jgi:hypothetical protein
VPYATLIKFVGKRALIPLSPKRFIGAKHADILCSLDSKEIEAEE